MVNNCPMTDSLATDSLAFGHVVLVAHAPLASALLACAAHVFPEALSFVHALDIPADEPPEASLARVQALHSSNGLERCLVLTDVLGPRRAILPCAGPKLQAGRCWPG